MVRRVPDPPLSQDLYRPRDLPPLPPIQHSLAAKDRHAKQKRVIGGGITKTVTLKVGSIDMAGLTAWAEELGRERSEIFRLLLHHALGCRARGRNPIDILAAASKEAG